MKISLANYWPSQSFSYVGGAPIRVSYGQQVHDYQYCFDVSKFTRILFWMYLKTMSFACESSLSEVQVLNLNPLTALYLPDHVGSNVLSECLNYSNIFPLGGSIPPSAFHAQLINPALNRHPKPAIIIDQSVP